MKLPTLNASERRTVGLAAVVVLPALLFIYVVRPFRAALADARDQIATEESTLARERAAIATARRNPMLQHVADSASREMAHQLFTGRDPVMMSAELASYLGDQAQVARVWLQDASTRPATTANGVRTLHVDVRGESDLRGILRFLAALEHGSKLVRIERLDIARSERGIDDQQSEVLTIAATVSGFSLMADSTSASLDPAPTSVARIDPASVGRP